jgi:quinol monooxygenase YgiN
MVHVVTYIDIDPKSIVEGLALLKSYREAAGAIVLQETSRRNRFAMIEAWNDEPAFQAHDGSQRVTEFRSRLREIHNSPYDQRVHHTFAAGPQREAGDGLLHTVTHVDVPPPRKDETELLLTAQAVRSRTDDGNVRYDVFQQKAPRTNHFTVFAVWKDEAAFLLHQAAPHTREFREELGPKLGAPYDERLYSIPG